MFGFPVSDEVSDKLQEVDQSATRLKDEEKRLHKDTLRRITESVASLDKRVREKYKFSVIFSIRMSV